MKVRSSLCSARRGHHYFSHGQARRVRLQGRPVPDVRFWIDGKTVSRCYSVSSAPEATGYLEISVKRQGLVSGLLHATVRPGSLLDIMRPAGGFVYPSDDHRPITLLAGGVGITPLMSMLRHAVQADPTRPVTLLYSVRTQHDVAFRDELAWLARRHRQAKVVVTTSDEPPSAEFLSGMINRELLTSQVEDLQDNIFLLCGPPPMIKAMKGILGALGVAPDQVRFEEFAAAVAFASARAAGETAVVEVATPAERAAATPASGCVSWSAASRSPPREPTPCSRRARRQASRCRRPVAPVCAAPVGAGLSKVRFGASPTCSTRQSAPTATSCSACRGRPATARWRRDRMGEPHLPDSTRRPAAPTATPAPAQYTAPSNAVTATRPTSPGLAPDCRAS